MAFKKGKEKTGGRAKGTPNRKPQELLDMIQAEFPNYHPLLALAGIANGNGKDDLKLQAHKEICKYINPQLRAVDLSSSEGFDINVTIGEKC